MPLGRSAIFFSRASLFFLILSSSCFQAKAMLKKILECFLYTSQAVEYEIH